MRFIIEEDQNSHGYKHVHADGCRDVRDPEPVESEPDIDALYEAVQGMGVADAWDDYDEDDLRTMLAPCATGLIRLNQTIRED